MKLVIKNNVEMSRWIAEKISNGTFDKAVYNDEGRVIRLDANTGESFDVNYRNIRSQNDFLMDREAHESEIVEACKIGYNDAQLSGIVMVAQYDCHNGDGDIISNLVVGQYGMTDKGLIESAKAIEDYHHASH
jgi:hypothetical protein